ncbi:O-methyltransferase [uncultured Ruegeria sp.]|uniref:O-methyltransferase n=1 Tax=uncultured Ruegeria sp. TaxID=259304 RepID=UPI002620B6B4|nr:class I SAM-dependent methyltransferase [uncultured Ruegeria sp.]
MFFSSLASAFGPKEVVEIGSAFGVSGMYWCAGLSMNDVGNFTGFEPNSAWAPYAKSNISKILGRARLVEGTFEDNLDKAPASIDLAFIDAIHAPEFVENQLNLVLERARKGTLIVLDDIRFSKEMSDYWSLIRDDNRFSGAFEYTRRVGFLEVSG